MSVTLADAAAIGITDRSDRRQQQVREQAALAIRCTFRLPIHIYCSYQSRDMDLFTLVFLYAELVMSAS
jgi:hypothetical protein